MINHEGTWQPHEKIQMTYEDFLAAIKDATAAGVENERTVIAERVNKLYTSAIEIGADPRVIDGLRQALTAIAAGGVQE